MTINFIVKIPYIRHISGEKIKIDFLNILKLKSFCIHNKPKLVQAQIRLHYVKSEFYFLIMDILYFF